MASVKRLRTADSDARLSAVRDGAAAGTGSPAEAALVSPPAGAADGGSSDVRDHSDLREHREPHDHRERQHLQSQLRSHTDVSAAQQTPRVTIPARVLPLHAALAAVLSLLDTLLAPQSVRFKSPATLAAQLRHAATPPATLRRLATNDASPLASAACDCLSAAAALLRLASCDADAVADLVAVATLTQASVSSNQHQPLLQPAKHTPTAAQVHQRVLRSAALPAGTTQGHSSDPTSNNSNNNGIGIAGGGASAVHLATSLRVSAAQLDEMRALTVCGLSTQNWVQCATDVANERITRAKEALLGATSARAVAYPGLPLSAAAPAFSNEAIRLAYIELADAYYLAGKPSAAFREYARAHEYSSTRDHILEFCFTAIRLCFETGAVFRAQVYIAHAEACPGVESDPTIQSKLRSCRALVALHMGDYWAAANWFSSLLPEDDDDDDDNLGAAVGLDPESNSNTINRRIPNTNTTIASSSLLSSTTSSTSSSLTSTTLTTNGVHSTNNNSNLDAESEPTITTTSIGGGDGDGSNTKSAYQTVYKYLSSLTVNNKVTSSSIFRTLITPAEVGLFTIVCAMATFTRQQLRDQIVCNPNFSSYLEAAEPCARELVMSFYKSSYATCWQSLSELLPLVQADRFLSNHVDNIAVMIERRIFTQYLIPYHAIYIDTLLKDFGFIGPSSKEAASIAVNDNETMDTAEATQNVDQSSSGIKDVDISSSSNDNVRYAFQLNLTGGNGHNLIGADGVVRDQQHEAARQAVITLIESLIRGGHLSEFRIDVCSGILRQVRGDNIAKRKRDMENRVSKVTKASIRDIKSLILGIQAVKAGVVVDQELNDIMGAPKRKLMDTLSVGGEGGGAPEVLVENELGHNASISSYGNTGINTPVSRSISRTSRSDGHRHQQQQQQQPRQSLQHRLQHHESQHESRHESRHEDGDEYYAESVTPREANLSDDSFDVVYGPMRGGGGGHYNDSLRVNAAETQHSSLHVLSRFDSSALSLASSLGSMDRGSITDIADNVDDAASAVQPPP